MQRFNIKNIFFNFSWQIIGILMVSTQIKAQQVPLYTQYYFNPYVINPAYAGSIKYRHDIRTTYRNQWIDIEDAPITFALTYNSNLNRTGWGLMAFADAIGKYKTTGLALSYAYHFNVTKHIRMGAGLSGQLLRGRLDTDLEQLSHLDPNDPALINAISGQNRVDFNVGLYLYDDNFYFGVSAPNLVQTKLGESQESNSLDYISSHLYGIAGYKIKLGPFYSLEPSIMVRKVASSKPDVDINAKIIVEKIFLFGANYRLEEKSFALLIGGMFNGITIGFSNDFSLGDIQSSSQEVVIGVKLGEISTAKPVKQQGY